MLLPLSDEQISLLPDQYNRTINNSHIRIPFNEEKLQKRKIKSNALENPSAEELKVATVVWLNRHKPEVLLCKVEKSVEDSGGKVLWTTNYCLDLQKIELYWSEEKGGFYRNYYFGRSVKSTVSDIRDS